MASMASFRTLLTCTSSSRNGVCAEKAWHRAPQCGIATNDLGGGDAFVGRGAELQLLLQAIAAVRRRRGSLVLVTGEAGVGKTRLVSEAAGHATDAGVAVAWGYGRQGGSAPLGPWQEALRRLGVSVEDLATGARGDPDRLFAAVADAIERVGATEPLLLVLEDLHWFDEQSVRLLEWLRPALGAIGAAVMATARADVPRLGRPDHHVGLAGLSAGEVAALVASHGGADVDAVDLWQRTGGNPLFVLEVARETHAAVPRTVAEVVRQRLDALDDQARGLVLAAAVVAASAGASALAAVAGLEATALDEALDGAIENRFLVPDTGRRVLRFQHDLVRDAVYGCIDGPQRRRLHAAAARAISRGDGDPAEVARHLVEAGAEGSDAEAARWAERAGDHAVHLCAYEEAAHWFDEARLRAGAGGGHEARLRLRAAHARWRAGDRTAAWSEYEAVARQAQAEGDPSLLAEAALGFGGGRAGFEVPPTHTPQRRLLAAALDALPPHEHELRALLLSRLSITLAFEGQPERQRELAAGAVEEARRSGETAALVTALAGWCDAHGAPEHAERRLATADEMISLAAAARDVELELLGLRFRIVALFELGRRGDLERAVQRFAELADELRQPGVSFYVPLFTAALALADGRIDDAQRLNAEAAEAGAHAQSDNADILTTSQRFALALETGRAAEVEPMLRAVVEERPEISGPQAALALVAAHLGKAASARARLDHLLAGDLAAFPVDSEWLSTLATLAETATRARHVEAARALLPRLLAHGDVFAVDGIGASVFGTASYFAGRLGTLAGDDALGEKLLRSARDRCRRFCAPLLVAKATWALADACAARAPGESAELRGEALSILDELGLGPVHLWPPPGPRTPATAARGDGPPAPATPAPAAAFRADGDVWTLRWRAEEAHLRDTKGLRYLRELLARPGREVHVLDLAAPDAGHLRAEGDLGPVLDDRARAAYRRRIDELREELDDATARNDLGAVEKAEVELEQLMQQLAAAAGLGGRARRPGSAAERARVNVTKSIKQTIERIECHLPALAHHLRSNVRTGTFCVYEPDPTDAPRWDLG